MVAWEKTVWNGSIPWDFNGEARQLLFPSPDAKEKPELIFQRGQHRFHFFLERLPRFVPNIEFIAVSFARIGIYGHVHLNRELPIKPVEFRNKRLHFRRAMGFWF